jgi:uncharacterized lipoprotein YmbA
LLVVFVACSFGGSRPSYEYYVLTSAPRAQAQSADRPDRTLAISHVAIPRYLDREQIVTRLQGSHVTYSTTDRWAEPLDEAFTRTLRENLAARLESSEIAVEEHEVASTYALDVDVLRFERIGPHEVELWAQWTLRSGAEILDRGDTRQRVRVRGAGSNAAALALSETIARMATDIAAQVRDADVVAARTNRR